MKRIYFMVFALVAALLLASCAKDDPPPVVTTNDANPLSGLGSNTGYPTGKYFKLPSNIRVLGDIRGGLYGKAPVEKSYTGPFNVEEFKANWVTLGTGTYVNLFIQFYNSALNATTFTMPGGLIFIDSSDLYQHIPVYQKGYILQDVEVTVPALDTAFIQLRAYCLNAHLAPSSYDAVYYFGPITNNTQLNTITTIMNGKQYPYGEEYNIQQIVWNVTDNGLTLTSQEIAYLNGLP